MLYAININRKIYGNYESKLFRGTLLGCSDCRLQKSKDFSMFCWTFNKIVKDERWVGFDFNSI